MQNLFFWNEYPSFNKLFYKICLCIILLVISLLLWNWQNGNNAVINWQILSELGSNTLVFDQFIIEGKQEIIPAKVHYITEQFVASNMEINHWASYIWLIIFALGYSFIAAAVTKLPKYWYYGAMAILILVMANLSLNVLFNSANFVVSGAILFLFLSISFYFFSFNNSTHLWVKTIAFILFFALISILIENFSAVSLPFLLLSAHSIPSALVLAAVFIFIIAYEIPLVLLSISTTNGAPNGLMNFTIGTLVYLINIFLSYLHNINYLNWQILYLSPVVILIVSILFGVWGFKKRENQHENILDYESGIFLIYIGLSIITLGIYGYGYTTGNDPLIEALEDAVLYTHLVMGVLFYMYVFLNFIGLFQKRLDVGKVVFRPQSYKMLYFNAFGILTVFAILSNNDFFPVMQSVSAFYNAQGDYAMETGEFKLSEAYYKNALKYERQNHKSNYALASLAAIQGDNRTAGSYYRLAVQKKPSEYAFAALSQSLTKEDLFFESMFALKDGLKIFPKSGELQNNLALLFEKSKLSDSTLFYLEKAKLNTSKPEVIAANLLSFAIKYKGKISGKENKKSEKYNYNSFIANSLAIDLISGEGTNAENDFLVPTDSVLTMSDLAWLNNQTLLNTKIKRFQKIDFEKLKTKPENQELTADIVQSQAISEYYGNDVLKSFELLAPYQEYDSTQKQYFNKLIYNGLKNKLTIDSKKSIAFNVKTFENDLAKNPLNVGLLKNATNFFNNANQPKKAYDLLIKTLDFQKNNPEITKLYILQALKIHMGNYALDALDQLQIDFPNDYKAFLPVYQAQRALMEKDNLGFQ